MVEPAVPRPVALGPNCPPRFFAGGAAIAQWRGVPDVGGPEDWVASTTPVFGRAPEGLTRLPDGTLLRDAIAADPVGWLGPEHAAAWGADAALLVKLLDAGQRLPLHCHPDREFARRHLGGRWGKTEAWVVAAAQGARPVVHLGFRTEMRADELATLVAEQRTDELLAATNTVPVAPGDVVLVPAGLPHAIGAGVFVIELQEPSDLSVLLEWDGFGVDGPAEGHLGVGFGTALQAVDRSAWDARRLAGLTARRAPAPGTPNGVDILLPRSADPYFRAEYVHPTRGPVRLDPGYSVLAVLAGTGMLSSERGGDEPLHAGQIVLVPHAAGAQSVSGDVRVLRCRPPDHRHADAGGTRMRSVGADSVDRQ
ncbi:MAG: class I mannose-6-phosphate isomerase [Actinomycetota bacterium]